MDGRHWSNMLLLPAAASGGRGKACFRAGARFGGRTRGRSVPDTHTLSSNPTITVKRGIREGIASRIGF